MRGIGPLWIAGGGLVAGWLAVAPSPAPPVDSGARSAGSEAARQQFSVQFEDLSDRLREQPVPLRPFSRNPFRFGEPMPDASESDSSSSSDETLPVPPAPHFVLAGIAEKETPAGIERTAIISGEDQLFLAAEGEQVGGRYRVLRIGPAEVELSDPAAGTTLQLVLP